MRWRKAGVWDRLFEAVSKAYEGDVQMIDSSSIRVHQHGANGRGANGKKGARTRRLPPLGTSLEADAWGARAEG
jgi:transposase